MIGSSVSPYLTIYKRSGDTFTKLVDPFDITPGGTIYDVAFSSLDDYVSIGHSSYPFMSTYKRVGDTFTRFANPSTTPPGPNMLLVPPPNTVSGLGELS